MAKKILLVDDSEVVLALERMVLRHHDYQTLEARDGDEAVALAESDRPDLILMDVMMPRMGGLAACRAIKDSENTRPIPIIMVTGVGELDSIESAYQSGCSDYVTKPINGAELVAKVRDLLGL